MIVDEETGEILTRNYEVAQYRHKDDIKPVVYISDIRSVDDMEKFMALMIDKRKIRGSNRNDLLRFFEGCLGYKVLKHDIFSDKHSMSVPQYKLLEKLGKLVEYKNIIMITRDDLCEYLNCKDNNLMKKLKPVSPYLKVYTQEDGIRKGEIKILINPKFFYIYEYGYYDMSREQEINKWYAEKLREQSKL